MKICEKPRNINITVLGEKLVDTFKYINHRMNSATRM